MSNCDNSANSQLKAIQARLDRIDDDLIAHYAGISEMVLSLSLNPATSASMVKSLRTYNFSPLGQRFLKMLLRLIPGYDTFKRLQHLDSAALLDGMGAKLAAYVEQMAETAALEQVDALVAKAEAFVARATSILESATGPYIQQLEEAVALAGTLSVEDGQEAAVALAEAELTEAIASLGQIQQLQTALDFALTLSAEDGGASAVALAEAELADAIASFGDSALHEIQATFASADAVVQKVEGAINSIINFLTTLSDIADCRTRSQILR